MLHYIVIVQDYIIYDIYICFPEKYGYYWSKRSTIFSARVITECTVIIYLYNTIHFHLIKTNLFA